MDMKTIIERMKQQQQPKQISPEFQRLIDRIKQRKAEMDAQKKDHPTP